MRPSPREQGLQETWNDEIQLAIEEKKYSYGNYLQNKQWNTIYREYKEMSNSKGNDTKANKRGLG